MGTDVVTSCFSRHRPPEVVKGGLSLLSFAFMCHWKKVNLPLLSAVAESLLVFTRVNYHPRCPHTHF